jgi:hypothetical protein
MPIRSTKGLKFPILKNVEFCSIFKNKKSVYESDGKELEGKTWREFQLILGEKLPSDDYHFTLKFKNNNELHTGKVRAASLINKPIESSMDNLEVIKAIQSLKDGLNKAEKSGGISFEMLLASTKQGYDAQIQYLNSRLTDKDELIREIKKEVDELEDDLNECEKESAKTSGIGQYLAIGEKILSMKFGKPGKVSLKESDASDIPNEILTVLGIINWQIMDAENINKIANNIQQYLSVLPKEYFKGA